jgi:hypothetical protein
MRAVPLRTLLPAAAFVLLTGAAQADETRIVPSGSNQQIDFFASVNPDCSSPGLPTVRLVDGPNQGTITTDKARDFLPFAPGNVRAACNRKRVAGVKLFYRSAKGFMGTDHVRILIISAAGTGREARYDIQSR